jgi:hypothetical protein
MFKGQVLLLEHPEDTMGARKRMAVKLDHEAGDFRLAGADTMIYR